MSDTPVDVAKLVKVYLKMTEKRSQMKAAFEEEDEKIKKQQAAVKKALLQHCKDTNVESVKTSEGVFFRTVSQTYWTNDWPSMDKFVIEHQVPALYQRRLHQGNLEEFLKAHPDLLPPGLNVDREYSVTVRKK